MVQGNENIIYGQRPSLQPPNPPLTSQGSLGKFLKLPENLVNIPALRGLLQVPILPISPWEDPRGRVKVPSEV